MIHLLAALWVAVAGVGVAGISVFVVRKELGL